MAEDDPIEDVIRQVRKVVFVNVDFQLLVLLCFSSERM